MSFLKITLLFIIFSGFFSCKKTRTCECTNSQGTYIAGEVDKTKRQAKNYCKSLSVGETTCSLKE